MGNAATLFGAPPEPNPGKLPPIPSRNRKRGNRPKEPEKDIPTLILEAKANVEKFELLRSNAERAAAEIWKNEKNRHVPHKKKEAFHHMIRLKDANQNIDKWMNHLTYLQRSEANLASAETQKHIVSHMQQMKVIAQRESANMPNIEDVAELKEDVDGLMAAFATQNEEFNNLFTEPSTDYDLMTMEDEEELMGELDSLIMPKIEEGDPPENPGAGAEKVVSATEQDLDALLDSVPAAPTHNSKSDEPVSAKPKRKVALML